MKEVLRDRGPPVRYNQQQQVACTLLQTRTSSLPPLRRRHWKPAAQTPAQCSCALVTKKRSRCVTHQLHHFCKKRGSSSATTKTPLNINIAFGVAHKMSQPPPDDSEDPFSPGKQYILPGEQSSGEMVDGSGGGNGGGSCSDSSKDDSEPEEGSREATIAAFRASLYARGMQNDSQVFYDTTPNGELSPAHGGMEGYEASMEGGAGRYDDSDEVGEDDGAHHKDGGNEANEDEGPDHEDDYIHDGRDFPTPLEYNPWSNDPPSGSDNNGDDSNFIARLTVALQNEADNAHFSRHVEIADSQAGSDDLDNTVIKVEEAGSQAGANDLDNNANYAASSIRGEVADSQADSGELENTANYVASSGDEEMADSQAGSDDLDNTANDDAPPIKLEVADSQADSNELENTANYAASSSDEEMADSQAGSDDLDNTANHPAPSIKVEVEDSEADSDDLDHNANRAAWSSDEELADSQAGSDYLNNTLHHADSSIKAEEEDSQADSDDNTSEAASSSDKEIADSQADSDDTVVRSDASDSDSDADTIVVHQYLGGVQRNARGRLAPVRTPKKKHRKNHNPGSDPDSSSDQKSDSTLSELEGTPEPVDPDLLRLELDFRRRALKLCTCLGWCTCSRYSSFYGTENPNEATGPLVLPSQTHLSESALSNERFPTSAMRSTIAAEERYEESIVQPFSWDCKRRPALAPISWEGEEWKEFPGNYQRASVEEVSDAGD